MTEPVMPNAFVRLYELPHARRTKEQQALVDAISETFIQWFDAEARADALEHEIVPLRTFRQDVLNRSVAPKTRVLSL